MEKEKANQSINQSINHAGIIVYSCGKMKSHPYPFMAFTEIINTRWIKHSKVKSKTLRRLGESMYDWTNH